jgi:hypothetical protein
VRTVYFNPHFLIHGPMAALYPPVHTGEKKSQSSLIATFLPLTS